MDASHVDRFLTLLGCDRIRAGNNGWINAACPLARWKHPTGKDDHPSFGVSVEPSGLSFYRCFSCGARGELTHLVWALARLSRRNLSDVMVFLQHHNQPSVQELEARISGAEGYWTTAPKQKNVAGVSVSARRAAKLPPDLELPTLPESDLDGFREVPAEVMAYLLGPQRNLTAEDIARWQLGWHAGARRVVIPIRDRQGRLVGISGRAFNYPDQTPKFLHSSGFRRDYYLYGEDKIRVGGMGYLCEGFFDVIYLQARGYAAVAMMGSSVSRFQAEKIKAFFSGLTIVPDGDAAGSKAAAQIEASLSTILPTTIARVPEGKDPDQLCKEELISLLGEPAW